LLGSKWTQAGTWPAERRSEPTPEVKNQHAHYLALQRKLRCGAHSTGGDTTYCWIDVESVGWFENAWRVDALFSAVDSAK
jgi:hypothetical protein